jgi:hypothetical protein
MGGKGRPRKSTTKTGKQRMQDYRAKQAVAKRRATQRDNAVKIRDGWLHMEATLDLNEPTKAVLENCVERMVAAAQSDQLPSMTDMLDVMRQMVEVHPDIVEAMARAMRAAGIDRPDFLEAMARVYDPQK